MTGIKTVLVIDREHGMIYANALKSTPVLCKEHQSYVWYFNKNNNKLFCKKGKHWIDIDRELFQLVEL